MKSGQEQAAQVSFKVASKCRYKYHKKAKIQNFYLIFTC